MHGGKVLLCMAVMPCCARRQGFAVHGSKPRCTHYRTLYYTETTFSPPGCQGLVGTRSLTFTTIRNIDLNGSAAAGEHIMKACLQRIRILRWADTTPYKCEGSSVSTCIQPGKKKNWTGAPEGDGTEGQIFVRRVVV